MATTQEQQNQILDFYLNHNNPNSDPQAFYDTDQAAAEQASAAGGQTFSGARRGLLRRSQVMQNLAAATPILSQRAGAEADLAKLAQAGQQAQELERLSQQGQLRHDTDVAAAQRADTILKGQQAILQLQQTQQGDQILKQMGITEAQRSEAANFVQANLVREDQQQFTAGESALDRSWNTSNNALNRANSFNTSKLNANTQLATSRLAHSTFDDNATQGIVQQIINGTSGKGGWSGGDSGSASGSGGNNTGSLTQNSKGFQTTVDEWEDGTGWNWLQTNPNNTQSVSQPTTQPNNQQIDDEDFYYLTGGESG